MRRPVIALVAAVLTLAGCAGSPEETPGGTAPPPAAEETETAEPPESAEPAETAGPTASPAAVQAELTVTLDESGSGTVRTMTLTCEPVGGDHPDAAAACAALAAAGAEAFDPTPQDAACTQQYGGPQVATVEGTVAGAPVSAQFSRTDGCEIARWDVVAPLLGSSGGM